LIFTKKILLKKVDTQKLICSDIYNRAALWKNAKLVISATKRKLEVIILAGYWQFSLHCLQ
jgi:hypothetical protein